MILLCFCRTTCAASSSSAAGTPGGLAESVAIAAARALHASNRPLIEESSGEGQWLE